MRKFDEIDYLIKAAVEGKQLTLNEIHQIVEKNRLDVTLNDIADRLPRLIESGVIKTQKVALYFAP